MEREGAPVFTRLGTALECARKVLREGVAVGDLSLSDGACPVRLAHLQLGDKLVRAREAFNTLDTARAGRIGLQDLRMAFRIYTHRDLARGDLREILEAQHQDEEGGERLLRHLLSSAPAEQKSPKKRTLSGGSGNGQALEQQPLVDFDHFCCILAEFKNRKPSENSAPSPTTASGSSGGKRSEEVLSGLAPPGSRRGKASSILRKTVLAPLSRFSSWVGGGGGGGRRSQGGVQLRRANTSPGQSSNLASKGGGGGASANPNAAPSAYPLPPASVLLSRRGSQVRQQSPSYF